MFGNSVYLMIIDKIGVFFLGVLYVIMGWDKQELYKEIAYLLIGRPNFQKAVSARAVANACGKNPLPLIIPCHRAIRSDGTIGGYSGPGGAKQKIKLLKMEKLNTI